MLVDNADTLKTAMLKSGPKSSISSFDGVVSHILSGDFSTKAQVLFHSPFVDGSYTTDKKE